jgi:hypothetical protein
MNAAIFAYFMPNVDKKTVEAQAAVIKKFNRTQIPFMVMQGEITHAQFIDYIWSLHGVKVNGRPEVKKELDFDVLLFLDIDCVPLNENAIDYYLSKAFEGKLIGNVQRSGHINNNNHLFVAPSAMAISVDTFKRIGCPSAVETNRSDVAEEYTYAAEKAGVDIEYAIPMRYDRPVFRYEWETDRRPYWTLENGLPNFAVGTTFGKDGVEMFWHSFQIFHPGQQEQFQKKCEELLNG